MPYGTFLYIQMGSDVRYLVNVGGNAWNSSSSSSFSFDVNNAVSYSNANYGCFAIGAGAI